MTEQEKINLNVETRVGSLKTKFEMFMQEMRHKPDADMKSIDTKLDRLGGNNFNVEFEIWN